MGLFSGVLGVQKVLSCTGKRYGIGKNENDLLELEVGI